MGEFLQKRADEFFEEVEGLIKKKKYNMAAHHLEQTAQLYLKYAIYRKLGDFPQIHPLSKLLDELGKAYNKSNLMETFMDENLMLIKNLEVAYIFGRYMDKEYTKKEVDILSELTNNIIKLLKDDFC